VDDIAWLLSPRNSLAPAVACVVLGSLFWLAIGRRRRLVWPALVLAGLGLGSAVWRLSVVSFVHSIDIAYAERILLWAPDYYAREPRPVRIQGDRIRSAFDRVKVIPGMARDRAYWWIRFEGNGRSVTYGIAASGEIAEEIPGASTQDVYVPLDPAWPQFLRMELHYMYDR